MQLYDIFLYVMGIVLTLLAMVASYFMLSETGLIFREIIDNRRTRSGDSGSGNRLASPTQETTNLEAVEQAPTHPGEGDEGAA